MCVCVCVILCRITTGGPLDPEVYQSSHSLADQELIVSDSVCWLHNAAYNVKLEQGAIFFMMVYTKGGGLSRRNVL